MKRPRKRPYKVNPAGRVAHSREMKARRDAAGSGLNRQILEAVHVLTPAPCPECSTPELLGLLRAKGLGEISHRGISSRLGLLRKAGLISSKMLAQRHMWTLTQKGRGALCRRTG
jgi:hypothetical protein